MPKKGGGGKKKKTDEAEAPAFWKLLPAPGRFDRERRMWIPSYKQGFADGNDLSQMFETPRLSTDEPILSPTLPEKVAKRYGANGPWTWTLNGTTKIRDSFAPKPVTSFQDTLTADGGDASSWQGSTTQVDGASRPFTAEAPGQYGALAGASRPFTSDPLRPNTVNSMETSRTTSLSIPSYDGEGNNWIKHRGFTLHIPGFHHQRTFGPPRVRAVTASSSAAGAARTGSVGRAPSGFVRLGSTESAGSAGPTRDLRSR